PGALPATICDLLDARGAVPVLVGGPAKAREKVAAKLVRAEVAADSAAAVAGADFVMGASSTGGGLEPAWLTRGSVVIDVAEPRDLPRRKRFPDALVVDGENVSLPP